MLKTFYVTVAVTARPKIFEQKAMIILVFRFVVIGAG